MKANTAMIMNSSDYIIPAVFIAFILILFVGKWYLNTRSVHTRQGKHQSLSGRTKYAEKDIFKYTSTLRFVGLAMALSIAIAAMNHTSYKTEQVQDVVLQLEPVTDITVEDKPMPRSTEVVLPPPPPPTIIAEIPDNIVDVPDIEWVDNSIDESTVVKNTPFHVPVSGVRYSNDAVEGTVPVVKTPPSPPPPPPTVSKEPEIFKIVEDMPRFPGCEDIANKEERLACSNRKLLEYLSREVIYPAVARENDIQGVVVVQFVVEPNGMVSNIELIRDIGGLCGEEAVRLVESMNKMPERWIPGKQRAIPVRTYFILPVRFTLKTPN